MIKSFEDFIQDYNKYYQCNFRVLSLNTLDIDEVIFNLYDCEDYEIDYDNDSIELF